MRASRCLAPIRCRAACSASRSCTSRCSPWSCSRSTAPGSRATRRSPTPSWSRPPSARASAIATGACMVSCRTTRPRASWSARSCATKRWSARRAASVSTGTTRWCGGASSRRWSSGWRRAWTRRSPTTTRSRPHCAKTPRATGDPPASRSSTSSSGTSARTPTATPGPRSTRSESGAAADALGDAFLLGRTLPLRSRTELTGTFGEAFAEALFDAPEGTWTGPVESSYGQHLVRITGREPATLPPLSAIRERILHDVMRAQREEAVRARIEALLARYRLDEND